MKNWSITKKLLVSPVIFTLALLILSWLSYSAVQSIRTTMDNLINVNSAKVIDAIDLQKSFGAMNGRMMRMIVWASTGLGDEESNKADIEALEGWLSTLQTKLETFKTSQTFNEEEQQSVDHIIEMAGHYFQASKDVIDAAKDDVTTAALFMFEVDDLYGKFNTAIGDQVTTWRTNATERFNQSHDEIDASITANATIVILILIIVFIITLFIAGGISKPVRAMTTAMQSLAKGQLDVQIPSEKRADEVGEMADALLIFKDNLVEMDQMRSAREVERKKQEDENRATMMDLADQLENAVSSIIITMGDKTGDILNVANAKGSDLSNNETSQSMEVAQASERTTTNADAVAGAIRELSGAISEIGQQVSQSTMIANEAVSKAQGANDKVTMLANAAQRIGEVVNLITDIAEQTNLLALNATIEAARAGEAGKGFAVVASEVKNLANQTANATDEIASQIAQIQGATEEAVEAIGDISKTINQIDQIAGTIAASVEEQDATTRDIAQNVQNVSNDAQAVADRIVNMTRNAARSHNTAIQVTWAAEDLKQPTDLLNSEVQGFLNRIRS